jgi:hypothetical protein
MSLKGFLVKLFRHRVVNSEARSPESRVRTFPKAMIARGIPNPENASPVAILRPMKIPAIVFNFV